MIGKFVGSLMAALQPGQAAPPVQPQVAPAAVNYGLERNWLCLPGRSDVCSTPVRTTALNPNGYGSTGLSPVAKSAPIDCFYVYPTISSDRGLNSDLNVDAEKSVAEAQFARFAGVCRPFSPVYRQMTLSAVAAAAIGADLRQPGELAYADVANAWRTYLAKYNGGRPFVLVGHSQGSLMLQELIKREIEGKPVARRMVRAIIPGFNIFVPQGKRVGGTFLSTPLCASETDTGCVMSWVSYREGMPPPDGAMFGWAPPGMTVGCTNPARPGASGWVPLDSYWFTRSALPIRGGPIRWSSEGPPPTPYVRTEGLVSGRCVNDGRRGYLAIRTNADASDKRTDRVGGEVNVLGIFLPTWGMHLADMYVGQGDVIRQLESLGERLSRPARNR